MESLRGLEGAATASYFGGLRAVVPANWGIGDRNRSPPHAPFKALISLTYTLVMAETATVLHTAGCDPCIGYPHQLRHARESVACGLVEPLRPLADHLRLRLVAPETLTAAHFSTSNAGCLLGKAALARFYSAYEENAQPLRRALRDEVKTLARLVSTDLPERATTVADDDPPEAQWGT